MNEALMRWSGLTVTLVCALGLSMRSARAAPPTACDLLSAKEVEQALGKPGKIQDATSDHCWWTTPYRTLSISIDAALFDEAKQMRMARELVQNLSPKHIFQDEPSVAPFAFSETLTINEWVVRFMKGKKFVTVKAHEAPDGLEAARRVAKLVYAKM